METRLQKPADPCVRGKFAWLQEQKEDTYSWSQMIMMYLDTYGAWLSSLADAL